MTNPQMPSPVMRMAPFSLNSLTWPVTVPTSTRVSRVVIQRLQATRLRLLACAREALRSKRP
jgi:hypothetical protein